MKWLGLTGGMLSDSVTLIAKMTLMELQCMQKRVESSGLFLKKQLGMMICLFTLILRNNFCTTCTNIWNVNNELEMVLLLKINTLLIFSNNSGMSNLGK
jgi:hypothetical protein